MQKRYRGHTIHLGSQTVKGHRTQQKNYSSSSRDQLLNPDSHQLAIFNTIFNTSVFSELPAFSQIGPTSLLITKKIYHPHRKEKDISNLLKSPRGKNYVSISCLFCNQPQNGEKVMGRLYQEVLTQHKHGLWAPYQERKPQLYHS